MRSSILLIASVAVIGVLASAPPVSGAPGISIQGYESGGSFTFNDGSYPIPVGVTMQVRIWDDFYACADAVVDWGDGTPPSTSGTGTGFASMYEHVYTQAGAYTITATQDLCPGTTSAKKTIEVGGFGNILDPSNPMFFFVLIVLVLAVIALVLANGRIGLPKARHGLGPQQQPQAPHRPTPRPRLGYSGINANMTRHLVRLREVPTGAPVQYDPLGPPHIEMRFGQPTNIDETVRCPACGHRMGYTCEGWFCMSPQCPLIGTGPRGFTRGTLHL